MGHAPYAQMANIPPRMPKARASRAHKDRSTWEQETRGVCLVSLVSTTTGLFAHHVPLATQEHIGQLNAPKPSTPVAQTVTRALEMKHT